MSEHHESRPGGTDNNDSDADHQSGLHDGNIVPPPRRARVWPWAISAVVLAALLAAAFVPLPYYVDSPGSVRATQPLVSIDGHTSYESDGVVMYTTVRERKATAMLLVQSWLDDTIDTIPEEVAVPTGDRKSERRYEQLQMDRSKLTSLIVAFDELGTPLNITGTGAFVVDVMAGLGAADVIDQGDVIVAVDGTKVRVLDDVRPLLDDKSVGDPVVVSLRRRDTNALEDVTIELGSNPEDPGRGYLGVILQTADENVELPFDIELDSGSVIGPSAGLAWTLGVIDRLSPGDLTGGRRVAVTGTVKPDGSVGPIGGIAQKVEGAKNAGAELFLYPDSTSEPEVARMKKIANGGIELVAVGSVSEALDSLDPGWSVDHR